VTIKLHIGMRKLY